MCDTMVALGNVTLDGSTLFAKNSDRQPNEAHELVYVPAADHENGEQVECTYVPIPQVAHTYAVFLAKPYWIWGAEMGSNEHGVTIGNEAVWSKIPAKKEPGLIGMDFLRLGLERGKTAREALDVIAALIEEHGQSGNYGHTHSLYYHNSFLIADADEAWVLETVDRMWIAEKVREIRAISNRYSIGNHWDFISDGVVEFAARKGWCKSRQDFHFARCFSDFIYSRFTFSAQRRSCATALMEAKKGKITELDLMSILRDHGTNGEAAWSPGRGLANVSICWHAGPGPIRNSQSVGSMVSSISREEQTHWVTGTSAPCTSMFKPIWLDAGVPDTGERPGGTYKPGSMWWKHETMHREVLRDFPARLALLQEGRDQLEASFIERAHALQGAPQAARAALSRACFHEADRFYDEWRPKVSALQLNSRLPFLYALSWQGFNRSAGLLNIDRVRQEFQRQKGNGKFALFGKPAERHEGDKAG
ncbi:MAG: C69 family dipeptidase [Anaerolineales bacterium]|nr:C69 family dipeptidase [Anaerolineales bacterium]